MVEHLLSYVTLGSVAIAAIATYVAVRNNSRQLGAQIFLAYSDRVREIRRSAALRTHDIEQTLNATFLVFELYELKRKGYVSGAIWSIWNRDIGDLLRANHFRSQWQALKARLRNHVHFVSWVEGQMNDVQPSHKSRFVRNAAVMEDRSIEQ